ncbi:MAG TPA: glycerol-3-phosphate 1-O-acyltransferase, partial [Gammaproteobacteria bacterium]|nr:glycerol-3-phosphate 1-O-acyltransferase [Gammaproteobacteria bacterium]
MILSSVLVIFAYLAGSISSAVVVCRLMGLADPRTQGSGNPGATNVLRMGSKKAAAITLLGDALKGLLPVLLAKMVSDDTGLIAVTGIAAFFGHLYPVFFGFKGGKGVATAAGVFIGVSFPVGVLVALTWLLVAYLTKISSISALVAASLSPLYFYFMLDDGIYTVMSILLAVVLIYRHRSNIRDLLAGN